MPATVAALVVAGIAPSLDHGLMLLRPSPLPRPTSAIDSAVAIAAPASTPGQEMVERGAVSFSTMTVSMGAYLIVGAAVTPACARLFQCASGACGLPLCAAAPSCPSCAPPTGRW